MPVPDAPAVVFPDAELVATAYLRANLAGVAVCTVLPPSFSAPIVRVQRLGGSWRFRKVLDAPRIDLDCWAATPEAVNDLIGDVRAVLEAAAGHAAHGGLITYSRELSGPTWRPETRTDLSRKGLTHELLVRPTYEE
jgi:hypothetical protein